MAKKAARSKSPSRGQLLTQLEKAPLVEVLGVLSASGIGGSWVQGDKLSTLHIPFASWRIVGGDLQTRELVVRRKVQERRIGEYQKQIKPDIVTRIRARVLEGNSAEGPQALLVSVVGPDNSDKELNAEVKRLQKPVTFKDATFGTFKLDRRVDWFEATTKWNGRKVRLTLNAVEPEELSKSLGIARKLWRAQKSWQTKVLAYAVEQLLPLKNGGWLGEDERSVTPEQFGRRMKLQSITVSPDGSFEFWHDDGDLFWGHSIQISGSLTKGLYAADIPG